jgi:sulfate transport system permease protein
VKVPVRDSAAAAERAARPGGPFGGGPPVARRVLPGFGLSLGLTLAGLASVVLIPLAALALQAAELGLRGMVDTLAQPRVLAALRLSFGLALAAALVNAVAGTATAWVLVRYRLPAHRLFDALVDLPFALPTAVAGIALTALYAPSGWLGAPLQALGLKVAYTPVGIFVALVFIGLPFVVRTVQPVLQDLDRAWEEAAATLGASRGYTLRAVVLPALAPAILTGFVLAFARAVGEYGSVIFIAGNLPLVSEIAPLLIVVKLEQYDYAGAAAIGLAMLLVSLVVIVTVNGAQRWRRQRGGA